MLIFRSDLSQRVNISRLGGGDVVKRRRGGFTHKLQFPDEVWIEAILCTMRSSPLELTPRLRPILFISTIPLLQVLSAHISRFNSPLFIRHSIVDFRFVGGNKRRDKISVLFKRHRKASSTLFHRRVRLHLSRRQSAQRHLIPFVGPLRAGVTRSSQINNEFTLFDSLLCALTKFDSKSALSPPPSTRFLAVAVPGQRSTDSAVRMPNL